MSQIATLTTGDDTVFTVQLTKDKAPFAIDGSATIQASVVTKDKKTILIAPVPVLEATAGSIWINSIVVVTFTEALTAAITTSQLGSAYLEIQVDDGGKITWFNTIKILQGTIDQ